MKVYHTIIVSTTLLMLLGIGIGGGGYMCTTWKTNFRDNKSFDSKQKTLL